MLTLVRSCCLLGHITKVCITKETNELGSDWHLDNLEIIIPLDKKAYRFNYQNWVTNKVACRMPSRPLLVFHEYTPFASRMRVVSVTLQKSVGYLKSNTLNYEQLPADFGSHSARK